MSRQLNAEGLSATKHSIIHSILLRMTPQSGNNTHIAQQAGNCNTHENKMIDINTIIIYYSFIYKLIISRNTHCTRDEPLGIFWSFAEVPAHNHHKMAQRV